MTPPKKKYILIGIIAALVVMAGAAAAKKFFSPPKITYITAPVARTDLEESVLATGILKAFKNFAVGAQVNGQLKTLHVALGDKGRPRSWPRSGIAPEPLPCSHGWIPRKAGGARKNRSRRTG